jgi:hypothetical protein
MHYYLIMREILFLIIFAVMVCIGGCNVGDEITPHARAPEVDSLEPDSRPANLSDFQLTVKGENFQRGAKVVFNGQTLKDTDYISTTQLQCTIRSIHLPAISYSETSPATAQKNEVVGNIEVYVNNEGSVGGNTKSNKIQLPLLSTHRFMEPYELPIGYYENTNPVIKADFYGNLYLIWMGYETGIGWQIYFSRSLDNGETWRAGERISENFSIASTPMIAIDRNNSVHAVWEGWYYRLPGIFHRYTTDRGDNWNAIQLISESNEGALLPDIYAGKYSDISVTWAQRTRPSNYDVFYAGSPDQGLTWEEPQRVTYQPFSSDSSTIATDYNGDIFIAWKDIITGNYEIFFTRSLDGGQTWSNEINLSNNTADSVKPEIELDNNGNIYVLWYELKDYQTIRNIYFTRSTDRGKTFSEPRVLSEVEGLSTSAVITVDENNNLNVAWGNFTSWTLRGKIYFIRSMDTGETWTSPVMVSGAFTAGQYPSITVGKEGYIYMVWEEELNGLRKILFTRSY